MPPLPVFVVRHVPHEDLGLLEEAFAAARLEVTRCDLFAPHCAFDVHRASALVIMGGPMNVDETTQYPFLAQERDWIRAAVQARLPVLGICLGAQLLARALGARVYPNGVKEIGWHNVEWQEAARGDVLFGDARPTERVFQWHGDTFDLPPGALHLASSSACAHQAFRYGDNAWGLQFHLELTPAMLDQWLAEPGNCCEAAALPYVNLAAIERAAAAEFPGVLAFGRRVFARFAELCRAEGRTATE